MKILVRSTQTTKIFRKGQEIEMKFISDCSLLEFQTGIDRIQYGFCIEVDGYDEGNYYNNQNDYRDDLVKFFVGVPDIVKGWEFVKMVE